MLVKAAHLASFLGNIGDIANHESFYKCFKEQVNSDLSIEQIEIRDFYRNNQKKSFDKEFVEKINQFDLFIIGGGNFFELCWDYSENGTTFNISNNLLKDIKVPILINAIGIDDNKGVSKENIEKFRFFLNTLFHYTNVYFSVRNDGSYEIFEKYYPEYIHKIKEIPDFGFFLNELQKFKENLKTSSYKTIGINIAKDMDNIRYSNVKYDEFLKGMADFVKYVLETTEYNISLFPHIQSDYEIILKVLELVDHKDKRMRTNIAGLIRDRELDTFLLYQECEIVFATRFHANICSIALNIPTFGIITYPKHGVVYEKINLSDRKFDLKNMLIFDEMRQQIKLCLNNDYIIKVKNQYSQSLEVLKKQKDKYLNDIKHWLER